MKCKYRVVIPETVLRFGTKRTNFIPWNFYITLGVSPQFFSIWTRVLNHNKYVEIKQFSKVDIQQNNISTVILLIKFLYQWDPRHLQGSRVVYIFIYTLYSCSI